MKAKVDLILRLLLGLGLVVFGLNKFIGFMPPPEMPEAAGNLMGAFVQSGYMMPLIAIVEIVTGALLLSGFFVPLALVLLAPLTLNIILFHLALAPGGIVPGLVFFAINVYLLVVNIDAYRPLLRAKQPAPAEEPPA
ncbi:MAG: DoxX family membrane protein [Opitutales bacterium]